MQQSHDLRDPAIITPETTLEQQTAPVASHGKEVRGIVYDEVPVVQWTAEDEFYEAYGIRYKPDPVPELNKFTKAYRLIASRELEVKKKISEIDRIIFELVNKRNKSKAIQAVSKLPVQYRTLFGIPNLSEKEFSTVEDSVNYTRSELIENAIRGEDMSFERLVYLRSRHGFDYQHYDQSVQEAFEVQNSFEFTVSDVSNRFHGVHPFPKHTRKHIKAIDIAYKRPYGLKLDWTSVALTHPVLAPARSVTAPRRSRNAPYVHKHGDRRTWMGEDLQLLPFLLKAKLLRSDLSTAIDDLANDRMRVSLLELQVSVVAAGHAYCGAFASNGGQPANQL